MKRIWISSFNQDKQQVKGFETVTILCPYGEDYATIKEDMLELGFTFTSVKFAGPDLMDCECYFIKI